MQVLNWKSIKATLLDIEDTLPSEKWLNEGQILDWCEKAASKIGVLPQYEHAVCFMPIDDHKFNFPKGMITLEMVVYKEQTAVTEVDIADLKLAIQHTSDIFYNGFLATSLRESYRPLRPANNAFRGAYHLDDTPDLDTNIEHEYHITPYGFATTSIKEGTALIAYFRYPLDDCGDIMIPDDADYETALKDYCLMRYWESRYNAKESGAQGLYFDYRAKWDHMRPMVIGKFQNLTSLDELEDFRQLKNRLTNSGRPYYSYFGNQATEARESAMGRIGASPITITHL